MMIKRLLLSVFAAFVLALAYSAGYHDGGFYARALADARQEMLTDAIDGWMEVSRNDHVQAQAAIDGWKETMGRYRVALAQLSTCVAENER